MYATITRSAEPDFNFRFGVLKPVAVCKCSVFLSSRMLSVIESERTVADPEGWNRGAERWG